jgi:hypothetical protein
MNKHVRSVHQGGNLQRRGRAAEVAEEDVSTIIRDLARDSDLEEVVLRVRGRARERIVPETGDEEGALQYVRDRRPGAGKKRRARRKEAGSDSDEFDEGAAKRFPAKRTVEAYMYDEKLEADVPIMSRSRWQAKYVMAKAKLMLVDEENKMRRDELRFWTALYEHNIGPIEGLNRQELEREQEREEQDLDMDVEHDRDPIEDMLSDEDIKAERR